MDSRSLALFLSVASHGSMGRAAAAMHMTQQALSKSIQRLEAELDVQLFERTANGTQPTPCGQALVAHAQSIVGEFQRLRARACDLRDGRLGHVAIGAGTGILEMHISRAVAQLCARLPGIRVTAVAGLAEDLLPSLETGELDIVAGTRPATATDMNIACETWFRDEIGIAVRRGHPLLRKRGLTLQDVAECRWVLPSSQHTFTRSCVACFASNGVAPPVPTVVTTSATFIDQVVAATDFLTFMPLSLMRAPARSSVMAQLKIPGSTWAREVCLFRRVHGAAAPAASALVQQLKRMAGEPAP